MSEALHAFGESVRRARHARGWSQERLAAESGLDRTYISGVERGVRNPSLLSQERIALALGLSLRDLFDGQADSVWP